MTTTTGAGSTIPILLKQNLENFDHGDPRKVHQVISVLDMGTETFAQNPDTRAEAGANPELWTDLRGLWLDLAQTRLDMDILSEDISYGEDKKLRKLCIALAKFTRNIVAGVSTNQFKAYENEPEIRRLLRYYTSWSAMEDSESVDAARALVQALSNTVTSNDALVDRLWELYMNLPEDEVVLVRLLASTDTKTLLTTLVFILNCTHQNTKTKQQMVQSKVGIRICIGLVDKMVILHEAEEGSEGGKAFDIGYAIISEFIGTGFLPDIYSKFTMKDEIITPHQTTLLKLLDSYLQSCQSGATSMPIADVLQIHESLGPLLAKRFFALSDYTQKAIHKSLGMTPRTHSRTTAMRNSSSSTLSDSESSSELETIDKSSAVRRINTMLPKVCEALVLLTQCITTVSLVAEEQRERRESGESTIKKDVDMKNFFNSKKYKESGMVECVIDLLSLLDIFLPRINFGKPVHPEGSRAGSSVAECVDPTTGFFYLKRDLVRLLGVLCHGVKAVQDRAREAGGLPVIMNMCVIDERNPYLREHAILTMRNLLKDNPDNQTFVDSIKPATEWAADGTLKSRVKMSKISLP